MNTPRTDRFRPAAAALLLTLAAALAPHARAQEGEEVESRRQPQQQPADAPSPEVARGKLLLEQGDAEGALNVLRPAAERNPLYAEAWHWLGLAYARRGRQQDALKALGQAVALRLGGVGGVPNAERFVKLSPEERATTKAQALRRYAEARESVEAYVAQQPPDAPFWRAQAEALKAQADHVAALDEEFAGATADSKAARLVILSKPDPGYTEEARRNGTGGRIRLRALFGADGRVKHLVAVRPLPHGLTERAFEAARRISFKPATVDGRPVSQFVMLEYGFALNVRGPVPGPRRFPPRPAPAGDAHPLTARAATFLHRLG